MPLGKDKSISGGGGELLAFALRLRFDDVEGAEVSTIVGAALFAARGIGVLAVALGRRRTTLVGISGVTGGDGGG